jgi:hypothetical protein
MPLKTRRGKAESTLKEKYGVVAVRKGTYDEQWKETKCKLPLESWEEWEPADDAVFWRRLVESFDDFAKSFGGAAPSVQEIVFFKVKWRFVGGVLSKQSERIGDFGAGRLALYQSIENGSDPLPIARSNKANEYDTPPASSSGIEGQKPGSPIDAPSEGISINRHILHELGHALDDARGPALIGEKIDTERNEWNLAAGWYGASLYDSGVESVRDAISTSKQPPIEYQITPQNWNHPRWIEQPMTHYALTAAHEDFAESVMAYIVSRSLLRSRSPRRHQFIESHKELWIPLLRTTTEK